MDRLRRPSGRPLSAAGRPLLSAAARPRCVALLAACAILMAALSAWVAHKTMPGTVDRFADTWIRDHFSSNLRVFSDAVWLGDPRQITIICAVIATACATTRRWRGAFLVALAVPLAGGITELALKPLIHRTVWGNAFPSGHTTGVCAVAVAIIVLLIGPRRPPLPAAWRWLLSVLTLLMVALTALAVVALHFHHFTDTIGGALVGTAIVLLMALVIDWLSPRLARRWSDRREPAAHAPASDRAASDRAASDRAASDRTTNVRTVSDRAQRDPIA